MRFPSFALLLVFAFIAQFAAAQQTATTTPQSPPHTRKAPPLPAAPAATDQEQFISFWTTETGWRTELQFRNNQVAQDLTVTPVLRTADGTETSLSPVTIKPQEVKSIDLDTAIGTSAPQVIGTYGSVVLRYHSVTASNLYAVAMIRGTGHSIAFHIDGMEESQEFRTGGREGIWWFPNSSVSDYLILTNQSGSPLPLDLSLFDASGKASTQKFTLAPGATNRLSVRQLITAAGLTGSYGGIKVYPAANAGSLNTLHVLFDQQAGLSAIMKMFDYDPKAQIKERDHAGTGVWTLRAPMLALSNPDPALAFPVGTTLHPQLFVRNTTAKAIDASVLFNWRSDAGIGKSSPLALRLGPYETRRIDVAALQNGKTLPQDAHWTSVTLTTNRNPDEVMAVAASFDTSLRYGAQTPFSDQLAFKWEGSMWEYDAQHNSIITVGNGGTKATQAAFTIFYNRGGSKYELEQTLQPDEQMWIDVGKLIRESIPDKNGKTLPANLTTGSYEIRDLRNKGVGTLFEGKVIYDKTYGHVTYGCALCCGYKRVALWIDPLGIPWLSTSDNGVNGLDSCGGLWEDTSDPFFGNWSTGNSSIATVDYYGTHTGQSVGSTTSATFGTFQGWRPGTVNCPMYGGSPGGGDNVKPSVVIQGNPTYIYIGQDPTVVQINPLFGLGNPSGGTYTWSTPDTTTSFDNPNAQDVHAKATNWTGGIQDTKIALDYTFNNQPAPEASVWVTKRIFKFLAGDSVIEVNTYNGPNEYGYEFQASYNVFANPGGVQLTTGSGVSTYENVSNQSANVPFRPNYSQGALTANSQLLDTLALINNQALPSGLSIVDSQDLGVGGFYVRNNTLTYSSTAVTVTNNGPYN